MSTERIGIVMNGITGRMGMNQHLARSIMAIRADGGLKLDDGRTLMPEPLLVGRNEATLKALSGEHGGLPFTTDLDAALADPDYTIYFDAQTTSRRFDSVKQAIDGGKHIYCEKPTADNLADAVALYEYAEKAGVRHGVVQDKLWLPGFRKLKKLIDDGFFGRILSVRGEFGYWVFSEKQETLQRPSWNYRAEDGGGLIVDMLSHWRYLIDNLFGNVNAVSCLGATHIPERHDEAGNLYPCTTDDSAYATFTTDHDIICHFNSSWCVRVRRDDLLTLQVDGTAGSAVAGLRDCVVQAHADTPRPVWNPDEASDTPYLEQWTPVSENENYENAFKAEWELFLKSVATGTPFPWDLQAGAKGVQLAELGIASWKERRWVDVPALGGR
jgi:predicted dehydrogenase